MLNYTLKELNNLEEDGFIVAFTILCYQKFSEPGLYVDIHIVFFTVCCFFLNGYNFRKC